MAHSTQALPISGSASMAVQKFGGTDERQEVTEPIPEGGSAVGYDVTTASTTAVAANAARTSILLQNPSSVNTIWLNLGAGTAAANTGIWLPPGSSVTLVDQRAITAIGTQGSGTTRLVGYEYTTT